MRTKVDTMKFVQQAIKKTWNLICSLIQRIGNDSLLRNSIYIMSTGVATSACGYLYWILAAHLYSAYEVGLGSALISVMNLGAILANLGMGSTLVQVLPRREAGHDWSLTLNAGLMTGMLAGSLTGIIMVVALPHFSPQFAILANHHGYAFALVVSVPIMTISLLLDQAFVAERAANNMLIRNAAVALLKIPLLLLPVMLLTGMSDMGIFLSSVVSLAIVLVGAFVLLIPRLRRDYRLVFRGMVGQVRSMLGFLTGNYFINLGGLSIQYLLPIVVSIRLSPVDNAYFYTTEKLGDFFLSASAAVAVSLFAEGSHAAENMRHKVRSSATFIGILLVPTMLFCFFAGSYILMVFGSRYAQHGLLLLRIEVISTVPDAITSVYISVLRVQKRLRHAALLNLSMASLTLVLSWILLPFLNIPGAGLAYLIAQTAGSLVAGIDFIHYRRHRQEPGITVVVDQA